MERPMITTERLLLRRARMDGLEDLHRVFADPRAMQFGTACHTRDIDQTRRWLAGMVGFSPVITDDFVLEYQGRVIGKAGCWRLGEIGFILHPDYWRKGPAQEALSAAIPHIFASLPIDRLEADVDPRNAAAYGCSPASDFARCVEPSGR